LLTLCFGPVGLLSYLVVRGGVGRRLWIDEDLRPSPEE
jgi:hypothetical protein